MQKILMLLLILGSMTACQNRNKTFHVDPELMPLYNAYVAAGKARGQDVSTDDLIMRVAEVKQDNKEGYILAYCRLSVSSGIVGFSIERTETPVIIVNKDYYLDSWTTADNLQDTVDHELTHCILGQKHKNTTGMYTFKDGNRRSVPTSLMNQFSVSHTLGYLYKELKEAYLDEVFGLKSSALIDNDQSLRSKVSEINSDQKVVYESISRSTGCESDIKVEHIDQKDEKVDESVTDPSQLVGE